MRSQRGVHLDKRRHLLPRDYLADPYAFGVDPDATTIVPPGGDEISSTVAELQHRLVVAWKRTRRPSAAALGRRFGMSKQTFSRVTLGQRWAGETVLAALLSPALSSRPGSIGTAPSVTRPRR